MAHHVAELITEAETVEGEARQEAQDRAAELILKLWANRRTLPIPADPLHGHLAAIKVLGTMLPAADPWHRFQRGGSDEALLGDMFGALVQLVMSGLMLTRGEAMRKIEDAEWDALSEEERFLVETLERWDEFFVKSSPTTTSLESFYATFLNDGDDSDAEDQEPGEDVAEPEPRPEPGPEPELELDPERERRAAILAHVETFQARLADLIERWRAAGGLDSPAEGSEDDK